MNILLATKNKNKFEEISKIFDESGNFHRLVYKEELIDVVEDGKTILENAKKKALEVHQEYKLPVIADDSGLFVDSLNGLPGLRSKRFAGEQATDQENIDKLLKSLTEQDYKAAYFKTVLYFYDGTDEIYTEGTLKGEITHSQRGLNGFGYDSVFEYENKTLAELTSLEKNKISHRRIAAEKLIGILNEKI